MLAKKKESEHAKMFASMLRTDPCFVHLIADLSARRQASESDHRTHTAAPLPPSLSSATPSSSSSLRASSMPLLPAAVLADASAAVDQGFDVVDDDGDDASSFHSVPEDFEASADMLTGDDHDDVDGEGQGGGGGEPGAVISLPVSSTDPDIHNLSLSRSGRGGGERRKGEKLAAVMAVARKALDWSQLSRSGRKTKRRKQKGGETAPTPEAAGKVPEPTGLAKVVTELRLEEGSPVIGGEKGKEGEEVEELGWPFVGAAKDAQAIVVVDHHTREGGVKCVGSEVGEGEKGKRLFRSLLKNT